MKDDRKYRILLQSGKGAVWVIDISHTEFLDGIQNGGLKYFNNKRQKILNFMIQSAPAGLRSDKISEMI